MTYEEKLNKAKIKLKSNSKPKTSYNEFSVMRKQEFDSLYKSIDKLRQLLADGIDVNNLDDISSKTELQKYGQKLGELISVITGGLTIENLDKIKIPEPLQTIKVSNLKDIEGYKDFKKDFKAINSALQAINETIAKGQAPEDYIPVRIVVSPGRSLEFLQNFPIPSFGGSRDVSSATIDTTGLATDSNQTNGNQKSQIQLNDSSNGSILKDDAGFGENVTSGVASTHNRLWDGSAYDRWPGDSSNGARVYQANNAGKTILSVGGSVASSGNNTLISAGSNKLKVFAFSLTTTSTTAVTCIFQSGASGTELWRVILQAGTGTSTGANLSVALPGYLFATASATLLNLNLSSAQTVHWSASYIDEAQMARLFTSGFELNSLTAGIEFTNRNLATSPIVIQSTIKNSGTYALKAPGGTNLGQNSVYYTFSSSNTTGVWFAKTDFYSEGTPPVNTLILMIADSTGSQIAAIRYKTNGDIALLDNGLTERATTTLTASAWHTIELKLDNTPASGSRIVEGRLDGSSFGSYSSSTAGTASRLYIGTNLNNGAGYTTSNSYYFDNIALNDDTGSFQNSWVGEELLAFNTVTGAGDNTGMSGSYANVDDIPPNDATDYISSATLNATSDFVLGNMGLSSTDTINVVSMAFRAIGTNATSSLNAIVVGRIKASSGGTVEEGAAFQGNNSVWVTTGVGAIGSRFVLYDLPGASTTAWSASDLDGSHAQVGIRVSTGNISATRVTSIWVYVGYTPGASTAISNKMNMLGVGQELQIKAK